MAKDPICGMNVSESTPLKIKHDTETVYFCSVHCRDRYAREHGLEHSADSSHDDDAACAACAPPTTRWYRNRSLVVTAVLIGLSALSYVLPLLVPFRRELWMYVRLVWWAILLGLVIGGIIDYYVPREYISHILARPKKRTILYSVLLGFLMSACNHGILALSIQLYKKGASVPAVISFLLASPWANFTLTVLMIGFFGLKGLYIIGSAIVIAVISGLIFQLLDRKGLIEKNPHTLPFDEAFSVLTDMGKRYTAYSFSPAQAGTDIKGVVTGAVALSDMVLWWILVGIGISSVLAAYVPHFVFEQYMGPSVFGLIVTLAVATIIEVCSEGMAPLAFEIYRQTSALGNSLVFLMAGVATDYTEIGLLWANIGRRTALWVPAVTVPQVIVFGLIANMIFK